MLMLLKSSSEIDDQVLEVYDFHIVYEENGAGLALKKQVK